MKEPGLEPRLSKPPEAASPKRESYEGPAGNRKVGFSKEAFPAHLPPSCPASELPRVGVPAEN